MDSVDVALATYNGTRYLPDFLRSVADQTFPDVRLVASDDNSTDGTVALVSSFRPDRTMIVSNVAQRGFRGNFENALRHCGAPYLALADQDDVWMADKIDALMARMKALEARNGPDTPILVCSDLAVVDGDLQPLRPSFFASWGEPVARLTFADLTLGNRVPGCAMLFNQALKDLALPFPETIVFHDWWLILIATAIGVFEVEERPLIRYRQHGGNQVGYAHEKMGLGERVRSKLRSPLKHLHGRAELFRTGLVDRRNTLLAMRERFGARLRPADLRRLDALLEPGLLRKLWRFRGVRAPFGRTFKLMSLYFLDEAARRRA